MTLKVLIPIVSWILLSAAAGVLLTVPIRYRLYLLPGLLIPATITFTTIQYLEFLPGLADLWGLFTLMGLTHFSSLLYIKKWTLKTTPHGKNDTNISQVQPKRSLLISMYQNAVNPRFVRVPYKSINIPEKGKQVKSLAIHSKFSVKRVPWLLTKIIATMLVNYYTAPRLFIPWNIDYFAPAKASLIRRLLGSTFYGSTGQVTVREILIRTWFTWNAIWTPTLLLDLIHVSLAIFFIYVIRVDSPDDWPDLFGSPLEAFTLGRFWSRFWHRLHLSGHSDYANLVIDALPGRLIRDNGIRKALAIFLVFWISGLAHSLTSLWIHDGCRDYADLQFFCLNGVAVISESLLFQFCDRSQSSRGDNRDEAGKRHAFGFAKLALTRLLGYTWVITFFIWAHPKFFYPKIYCTTTRMLQATKPTA